MIEVAQFLTGAAAPVFYFSDVGSRLFWLHWVTAAVCTFVVLQSYAATERQGVVRHLIDRNYWFNRSTAKDYGLMCLNAGLRTSLWLPLIGSQLVGTLAVARALRDNFGFLEPIIWDPVTLTVLYTFVYFLVDDFSRFALHLAMHRVPFLWQLHRTHHSATTLTPFTVFRVHPVESGIYFFRAFITFSLVTGVFVWLFGRHLSIIDVVGVNAIGFIANAAFANLRHSHVWVGFGRLELYFVSPAQHQLHHSMDLCRGNYGSVLSIWDRLAGTSELSGKRRPLTFGLVSHHRSDPSSQPVSSSWLSTAVDSKAT